MNPASSVCVKTRFRTRWNEMLENPAPEGRTRLAQRFSPLGEVEGVIQVPEGGPRFHAPGQPLVGTRKETQSPPQRHLYPVEKFVDEKDQPWNPAAPTGWLGYFSAASAFLKLCF